METEKSRDIRKRKIALSFFIFMGLMWLCTVISKGIYASKLPIVTVTRAEQKYIEHLVTVDGIIVAGSKIPVTALSGLRVEKLMVQAGDLVEEGDVLFTVDLEDLEEIIKEKQSQISKLKLQIDTLKYNEELAKERKALEEERAREDYDITARYQNTLVERRMDEVNRAEKDLEGAGGDDEALRDALQAAAYAEADAKGQRDELMKEAERRIEDILWPENADSSLEAGLLELTALQEDLLPYQKIKEAEGQITAQKGGIVTDIYLDSGSRIPDSAVMLLADDAVPCQFKATLNEEQKKYVSIKDKISLKLDGSSKGVELNVDYLSESNTMSGTYDILVNLPEGIGSPGISGTMTHAKAGEKYPVCVPPLTVHKEEFRTYVYVVKERDGILGMEYYVEEVNVKVLDENEDWAAIEGAIDNDSQIIDFSTEAIKRGDIVRF